MADPTNPDTYVLLPEEGTSVYVFIISCPIAINVGFIFDHALLPPSPAFYLKLRIEFGIP